MKPSKGLEKISKGLKLQKKSIEFYSNFWCSQQTWSRLSRRMTSKRRVKLPKDLTENYVVNCISAFNPVHLYRLMVRSCSTHVSILLDSWFDPVRLMIRPCLTHDSTLFDSWFDPVRLMIITCSTLSTLFDSWFVPVRLMIRPCSTHD